jgi:hypothetical protein
MVLLLPLPLPLPLLLYRCLPVRLEPGLQLLLPLLLLPLLLLPPLLLLLCGAYQ